MAFKKKYDPKTKKPARFWGKYVSSRQEWVVLDRKLFNREVIVARDRRHLIRVVKHLNRYFGDKFYSTPDHVRWITLTANAVV